MSDQASLVNEFKSVTGVDDERARFYLQSANWELHVSFSSGTKGSDCIQILVCLFLHGGHRKNHQLSIPD